MRDASTVRLDKVFGNLPVRENLGKARWITEELYNREGDAYAWAQRVSDRKEEENQIVLVNY
jgi:hypothetical protein